VHSAEPVPEANLPALQLPQLEEPETTWKRPDAHGVHELAPDTEE